MDSSTSSTATAGLTTTGSFGFVETPWDHSQQSQHLPLLTSPAFLTTSTSELVAPPSWQLDHAPSWQPPESSYPSSTFLSPLPLAAPSLPLSPSSDGIVRSVFAPPAPRHGEGGPGLAAAVDDFNGTLLSLLGSPSGGEDEERRGEEEDGASASANTSGSESEGEAAEREDHDEEQGVAEIQETVGVEQQESVGAVISRSFPPPVAGDMGGPAVEQLAPMEAIYAAVEHQPLVAAVEQSLSDPLPYPYQPVHRAQYGPIEQLDDEDEEDHYSYQRGDEASSPPYQESGDEYTPPTSNSSDHGTARSPVNDDFIPPPRPLSPEPFIPALSRPRSAHLRMAYTNEEDHLDRLLADADSDFDLDRDEDEDEDRRHGSKKRRRSSGGSSPAVGTSSSKVLSSFDWAPPPPRSAASGAKPKSKASKKKISAEQRGVRAFSPSEASSNGAPRKRTEIPAVEDDPSIKPYGCNYATCPARIKAKRGVKKEEDDDDDEDEVEETSFRTIRELREHCAVHKKVGMDGGDTPFRCALDPCGKTFKSLAGLRFHFQNASANGHFFVSFEEGEDRPLKKFKMSVNPSGRSEKCPISGCSKAFKQAAGLAYHLAHTANHDISEALLATFSPTLQSKTRWWFNKTNRKFTKGGTVEDREEEGDGEEESDEDEY